MAKRAIRVDEVGFPLPVPESAELPWAAGTKVGNFVFTSAQPTVGTGEKRDVQTQTREAFENLNAILEQGGLRFSDIVKYRIFLREKDMYHEMNAVRVPYFQEHFPDGNFPTATGFATDALPFDGVDVQFEAFACSDKRTYDTDKIVKRVPFAQEQPLWRLGAETEDLLWVTGQPGFDLQARVVGEDSSSQTLQSLENVRYIVEAGGFDFRDIVKATIYLEGPSDYAGMLKVRNEYFTKIWPDGDYPALTAPSVRLLAPGMRVEIEAIAARGRRELIYSEDVSMDIPVDAPERPLWAQGIRIGSWVFPAGMGPVGKGGRIDPDVRAQTRQTLENIESILTAARARFEDIVHLTVWLRTSDLYDSVSDNVVAYCRDRFPEGALPACTTAVGATPVKAQLVEIEAIAHTEGE